MLFVLIPFSSFAQDVIRASGGTDLSIDSVATGGFSTLDGPTIRETASGQLGEGGTITLTLPNGYVWNDALTADDITITIEPTGAANTKLEVSFGSITASEVTFNVDTESSTNGNGQGPGRVDIQGLELRPNTTDVPMTGEITNTGSTGPNTNYGNLSTAAGDISQVRVETEDDGSGQVVSSQDLIAGNSLTVYAIARDVGDNFIENVALDDEGDWDLINVTGDVQQSALSPSENLRSATFSSQQTGSAQIEANYPDVSLTSSETITVLPRSAQEMVIDTQPSSTATAGEDFSTQPVIFLQDQFGNKVTTDNSTEVTASISSGEGSLSGTQTQRSSNGEISFDNLFATVSETITLQFENPDFSTITSDEIAVDPASASDLTYIEQPGNTAQNSTISPPVEIQLLDEFGNIVTTDGIEVTISEANDEDFLKQSSTFTDNTQNGIATFDNLNITNSASEGPAELTSEFDDISSPVSSESFLIIAADELARFDITNANGDEIGDQVAGSTFNITVTAKDGSDSDYEFTDDRTVTITSDGDIQKNGSSENSFEVTIPSGESSADTDLAITSSGDTELFADEGEEVSGASNTFNVAPSTTVDETQSTVSADPSNITADGSSTSDITVQLKDEFGNNIETGGETVELTTTAGTFDGETTTITANDEGDGTYTATLTSSTTAGESASITATVNGNDISDDATVVFDAGDVDSFTFDLPETNGDPETQTAGEPFDIDVTAVDNLGNTVNSFNGSVTFSTNSNISSGATATFSNGTLQNHSITLTQADSSATITADADDLYQISGTSAPFEILANDPDPDESQINASPVVLQNEAGSESAISVILRDQYQNRIYQQENVSLDVTQLEEDNAASPDGNSSATFTNGQTSISNISFDNDRGIYRDTLISTTQIEFVEIAGSFGTSPSTDINQTRTIDIVVPNTWTAGAGGPSGNRTDWTNPENWSQGTVPTEDDFVIIPDIGDLPILDLNIEMGSFEIEPNVSLTLFGGNAIEVSGNVIADGNLDIEDNTELLIGGNFSGEGSFTAGESTTIEIGGNISLNSFLARTSGSQINLNGESPQTISTTSFLAQNLNVYNDVTVTDGDLIDTSELFIDEGNTFEVAQDADVTVDNLRNLSGDGQFILNNNTLVVTGDLSLLNIDTSDGTVVFGIRTDEDFTDYPDLEQQQIANLSQMQNAVINNTEGVRTFEDIIIDGDLTLENGDLIISSGKSLIAPNQTYNNGSLTIRRSISDNGWV
ncbi:MAG: invasin domain 3-containing protein, partial [Bacteroidota bacterium]